MELQQKKVSIEIEMQVKNYLCNEFRSPQMALVYITPDYKVHGANMGPTWGRQDPSGPHVDHVNLAIWDCIRT